MITDWKVGDKVVIKDPNFEARIRTITKVGRKLIEVGRQSFRADTYPCRSTGKYNDTLLYRPKDWKFLQTKGRIELALSDVSARLRATHDPDSFFTVLREKLDNIESEVHTWDAYSRLDAYDCTQGKT